MDDRSNLLKFLNLMETAIESSEEIDYKMYPDIPEPLGRFDVGETVFEQAKHNTKFADDRQGILESTQSEIKKIKGFSESFNNLTLFLLRIFLLTIGNSNFFLEFNLIITKEIKIYLKTNEDLVLYQVFLNTLFESIEKNPTLNFVILFLKRIFNEYIFSLYGTFSNESGSKTLLMPKKRYLKSRKFTQKRRSTKSN
jgi:hypothetical protein